MSEQNVREYHAVLVKTTPVPEGASADPVSKSLTISNTTIPYRNSLDTMYGLLDVRMVQPLELMINGKEITFWCDEEALLNIEPGKPYDVTQIRDDYGREFQLLGRLLLTGGPDDEGLTMSCPIDAKQVTLLFMSKRCRMFQAEARAKVS